jgi:hypothetical protein
MQAYRIERFGSLDGIELRSSDDPPPGLREVLMRVRASSLNYRDLMVLKGGGRGPTKLGVIPLSDGTGEVAAPAWRVIFDHTYSTKGNPLIEQSPTALRATDLQAKCRIRVRLLRSTCRAADGRVPPEMTHRGHRPQAG